MRFEVVGILFFFHAHNIQGHSEVRIDDRGNYFKHQNIVKAFDTSQPPWLYGYNFANSRELKLEKLKETVKEEFCTYFKKDDLNSTHVTFSRHQYKDKKQLPVKHLYGTFFTTLGLGDNSRPKNRTAPNGINVAYTFGEQAQSHFKLIYSDYNNCAIVRPYTPGSPEEEYLGASYRGTPGACVLLLSDEAARKMVKEEEKKEAGQGKKNEKEEEAEEVEDGKPFAKFGKPLPEGLSKRLPEECRLFYPHACGSEKFTVLFKPTCPKIPNVLGC